MFAHPTHQIKSGSIGLTKSEVRSQKLTHPSPLPGGKVGDLSFTPKIFRQSRWGGATHIILIKSFEGRRTESGRGAVGLGTYRIQEEKESQR
ncbi:MULTISPECIES: hypothetical protein [unclassified Okeania]|uniref:Uncharacterized protein n=1 Tax=Okeania hirsuta TaxID=1458930 RepID=A0A3N6NNH2_9CYAN|nr:MULTISPECIES: hypothetical protein [unclassified Okeania]NET22738.1 hypothetical protein [Okeania sp. SIO1H5]NET95711.1 hypothetical protein [Okeania sp. SIO1H2]RQH10862.1 hypothetical protein D4Z78_27625 [Okeania hirsuta]RQH55379.1 hypothetical protein D5R40_02215 [Okeania hirsuta]